MTGNSTSVNRSGQADSDCAGLYVHFPFCKRFCYFCPFVKYEYRESDVEAYLRYLGKELMLHSSDGKKIDTVFLGGGSPSLMNEDQIVYLVQSIRDSFGTSAIEEFTIETNPEDVSAEKAGLYRSLGINRVSVGVQSFADSDLRILKRSHNSDKALKAVAIMQKEFGDSVNIDLIVNVRGQKYSDLESNVNTVKTMGIKHVSSYILEGEMADSGKKRGDTGESSYFYMRDLLTGRGFYHYEVSNFAKPGFECVHNMKYWESKEYIGAGLSASGFTDNTDYKNHIDFQNYYRDLDQNRFPRMECNSQERDLRAVITGLRLFKGTDVEYFKGREDKLAFLTKEGFLKIEEGRVALNPEKILLLNEVLTELL